MLNQDIFFMIVCNFPHIQSLLHLQSFIDGIYFLSLSSLLVYTE